MKLARHEDQAAAIRTDKLRDHYLATGGAGPACPGRPVTGRHNGAALSESALGQPCDRAISGLPEARVGVLDPGGELDVASRASSVLPE